MNTKLLLVAVVALILGFVGGTYLAPAENSHDGMSMQMDGMLAELKDKTGDAFDQAFLAEMIVHHEGAVAMAQAALEHAGHQEIKQMAEAIISAQTGEIDQMRMWQHEWFGSH